MMQNSRVWLIAGLLTVGIGLAGAGGDTPVQLRGYVQYAPGHGAEVHDLLLQVDASIHYDFAELDCFVVSLTQPALALVRRNPWVVQVEEDSVRSVASLESILPEAAPLPEPPAQLIPWGVERVQAPSVWEEGYFGGGRMLCVIDGGYYAGHVDLPDDVDGISMVPDTSFTDDPTGRGSHHAGIVAALDNAVGVVGVSPGIDLYVVKASDRADLQVSRYSSDLVAAAYACEAAGADIISIGLFGGYPSSSEMRAFEGLRERGILSVAGMGYSGGVDRYPATYPSVISVGAVDVTDAIADFSLPHETAELVAPGIGILSTVPFASSAYVEVSDVDYAARTVEYSAFGDASGTLTDGGLCDVIGSWSGRVVLCERGVTAFYDKVMNVQEGGGSAAVIYNNEPGIFAGTLGDEHDGSIIPAVSISQEDGQYLVANKLLSEATVYNPEDPLYPVSNWQGWAGTPQAVAHVSAVAGLIWSANPTWSSESIRSAMQQTAIDLGEPGWDQTYGFGLVQAYEALELLIEGFGGMHVAAIDMSYTQVGRGRIYNVMTTVAIRNELGVGVSNAAVSLDVETPDGTIVSDQGITGPNGSIVFNLATRAAGLYLANISDVAHPGFNYMSEANLETSETLVIPPEQPAP